MTDDEAYQLFKDNYTLQVQDALKEHCKIMREDVRKRPESNKKQKMLDVIDKKETLFPSRTWFLRQKPPETRVNCDHTTGNCRDCDSSRMNYETVRRFVKSVCKCYTKECPKWICYCEPNEDDDNDPEDCKCDPCDCVTCRTCQVK